jgi:hypothetical protein
MYQLIISIIVIATAAGFGLAGINYVNISRLTDLDMRQKISADHLRLSSEIATFRIMNDRLPTVSEFNTKVLQFIDPPLQDTPDAAAWVYVTTGSSYVLCLDYLPDESVNLDDIKTFLCVTYGDLSFIKDDPSFRLSLNGKNADELDEVLGDGYSFDFSMHAQTAHSDSEYLEWSLFSGARPTGLNTELEAGMLSRTRSEDGVLSYIVMIGFQSDSPPQSYKIFIDGEIL